MFQALAISELLKPENLKTIGKWILSLIILGLLIYGAYRLYKFIKNKVQAEKDPSQNLGIVATNLSYTEAEYGIMADTLETAMAGAGTDEAAVSHVFNQMQTVDDLKKLIQKFGIRTKGIWPATDEWNLMQWLTSEFSQEELEPIQQIFITDGIPF
ncbi:MAG: hypothetical protein K9G46_07110 [Flavobacteriales bacterium]|nr:hypothetical protein [Flavobacteriales bacterium]